MADTDESAWRDVVRELGGRLGVGLELDAAGVAALSVDDELEVGLALRPEGLAVFAPVGRLPEAAREEIALSLLTANAVDGPLAGSFFSLLEDGETLELVRRFGPGAAPDDVLDGLAALIEDAFAWKSRLADSNLF